MTNETHNTNPVKTKSRRWFRFRLRTLLILVTLISVPLGWIGWELDQRRREKEAVAWVENMGGYVIFESDYKNDERNWWEKTKDKWLGESVWLVALQHTQVSDLSPLKELKNLESLAFFNTPVSDLSPLAELKNLNLLCLQNTLVNDLSPLFELKNLEWLFLNDAQVNDQQVQELRQALPNCEISF